MRTRSRKATDTYFELVKRFPLRTIRSDTEHRAGLSLAKELIRRDGRLDSGERDYLDMLVGLVEKYEIERFPIPKAPPLEVLKHLMEARDMRPTDLGKLIGSKANATLILKGHRELSKAHIRKLAEYFHVSPAVFI